MRKTRLSTALALAAGALCIPITSPAVAAEPIGLSVQPHLGSISASACHETIVELAEDPLPPGTRVYVLPGAFSEAVVRQRTNDLIVHPSKDAAAYPENPDWGAPTLTYMMLYPDHTGHTITRPVYVESAGATHDADCVDTGFTIEGGGHHALLGYPVTLHAAQLNANEGEVRLPSTVTHLEAISPTPDWVHVSQDGTVTVTPPRRTPQGRYHVEVRVTFADGSNDSIHAAVYVGGREFMVRGVDLPASPLVHSRVDYWTLIADTGEVPANFHEVPDYNKPLPLPSPPPGVDDGGVGLIPIGFRVPDGTDSGTVDNPSSPTPGDTPADSDTPDTSRSGGGVLAALWGLLKAIFLPLLRLLGIGV